MIIRWPQRTCGSTVTAVQTTQRYTDVIDREVCGGMLTFITYAHSALHFRALDINTGEITDLPLDVKATYRTEISPLGSGMVVAESYANHCKVYDALTGALRIEIEIPGNDAIGYRLGGDRLIVAEGRERNTCVVDAVEGRVLYRSTKDRADIRLQHQTTREILVTADTSDAIYVFDTRCERPMRTIKFETGVQHIVSDGSALCCVTSGKNRILFVDIATGEHLWEKSVSAMQVSFCGVYPCHRIIRYEDPPRGMQPTAENMKTTLQLCLWDPATGTEVFSFGPEKFNTRINTLDIQVVGGRVCVLLQNTLSLWE